MRLDNDRVDEGIGRDQEIPLISLIIPLYNEEKNIDSLLLGLTKEFEKQHRNYELILIDNGSSDKTPEMVETWASRNDHCKALHIKNNQGYGWGIINGLKITSGQYVGFMCGDGQIKPEDVLQAYKKIKEGIYDLVKVKRVVRRDGLIRKLVSFIYNRLFWVMFRAKSLDINGTPKIFKRKWLEKFDLLSKDWFIDAEIMIKSKYLNLKIQEVPVEFLSRQEGKSYVKFVTLFEFMKNIFVYRFGRGLGEWKAKI